VHLEEIGRLAGWLPQKGQSKSKSKSKSRVHPLLFTTHQAER
jgi:hypothetical protein